MFNGEGGDGGDSGQGAGGEGGAGKGGSGQQNNEPKMVSMTQEKYDESITKRLERGKKSWEKEFHESDDYKAFQEFQEGKKTNDQKIQEQLKGMDALKQQNAELTSKIQSYDQKSILTKGDVNPEFTEFVMHKLQTSMKEGDDFESVFESFKKEDSNAKYFGSQQQQSSRRQGQRHNGSGSKAGTASNIISKMYGDK